MKISKLLAIILSFQAAVQTVSLQEQYEQHLKNKDMNSAKSIAEKIKKLEAFGISPTTKIVEKLGQASTLEEQYVYYLNDNNNEAAERVAKEIKTKNSEKNLKQPQKKEERLLLSEELSNPAKIAVHTEEEAEKRLHALLGEIEETTKILTTIQKNVQIHLALKNEIQAGQKKLDTLNNRFNNLTENIRNREQELNALDVVIDIKKQQLRRTNEELDKKNEEKLGPDVFKTMKESEKRDEK